MAAVGLSIAGTAGLLLALIVSGSLEVGGPFAGTVEVTRTFFAALGTWVRSIFVGLGPGALTTGALVLGLLVLVGWQVVSGYQRTAVEQRGNTGYLEAAA
jgi:hypothetical protein